MSDRILTIDDLKKRLTVFEFREVDLMFLELLSDRLFHHSVSLGNGQPDLEYTIVRETNEVAEIELSVFDMSEGKITEQYKFPLSEHKMSKIMKEGSLQDDLRNMVQLSIKKAQEK